MNTKTILVVAAIIVVLGAGYAVARSGSFWNGMNGMNGIYGNGMMSGNGYGMMGNSGMMNQNGYGFGNHCGSTATGYGKNATPITIDEAKKAVGQYITKTGNNDLELAEVLQFENNFYAGIKEKSTDKYAFELLVNKYTGAVFPEMGPNMMWNTKYGNMDIGETQTTVTEEQALKKAQEYLDDTLPGTKVNDVDAFYGYYTMEVTKDGNIYGMLSVNSNTGSVWYHNWHGTFEKVLEVK